MTIYTRTERSTGQLLTVCRPEDIGADPSEGAWVTLCEAHSTLVYSDTRKLALDSTGFDFCDECREALAKPGDREELELAPTVEPGDVVVTVPRTEARANLSSIARHYVATTKLEAGAYVELSCECGHGDVVIDRLASETDVAELVRLLAHSLFDHISPRRIEATRVETALDLLAIPAAEDGSVMIGLGR